MPTAWGGSSRQIARACERHLALLALVGEDRPDLRTRSDLRTFHLGVCKEVGVQGVR